MALNRWQTTTCVLGSMVGALACGGSNSQAPVAPSPISQMQPAGWLLDETSSTNHVARFVDTDGTTLDYWRDPADSNRISDLRVRRPDGAALYLRVDSSDRPTYFQDPAGTRFWVNEYLDANTADVTIGNTAGEYWRGIVELPSSPVAPGQALGSGLARPAFSVTTSLDVSSVLVQALNLSACREDIVQAVARISTGACLYGLAAALFAPPSAPLALLSCGVGLVVDQLHAFACSAIRNAAELALNPDRITVGSLGEPASPIPARAPPPTAVSIVANDDSYQMARAGTLVVPASQGVLRNDRIPSNIGQIGWSLINPSHPGSLTKANDGSFTLDLTMPSAAGFTGQIVLRYRVESSYGNSNEATIRIDVR